MSGGVKAGLLFGLIAIPLTIGLSFVPYVGVLCCSPLLALGLGAGAGYLGLRWSDSSARIGQGLVAGGLTGIGSLLGSVIFFLIAVAIASALPGFLEAMLESAREQNSDLTIEDIQFIMSFVGPLGGACLGAFGLLFAFGGGALGGWLHLRQRNQAPPGPTLPATDVE
jgi:hypothetical protein